MQWHTRYSPIGLDIGTGEVKMVQLKRRGAQWVVHRLAVAPRPGANAGSSAAATPELGPCLSSLRASAGFVGTKVVSMLPCTEVDMRMVQVPMQTEPQDMQHLLRREAESYLPYSFEEAVMDYSAAGEDTSTGAARQRVLLVSTRRQSVDGHLALLQAARLHCLALETPPLALSRLLLRQQGMSTIAPVLVLDIGHSRSTAFILWQDVMMYNRTFPWSGALLTQAIAQDLQLSATKAEQLKQQFGIDPHMLNPLIVTEASRSLDTRAIPGILWQIVRPQLEYLAHELERILSYWGAQFHGALIDRMLLSGGSAALRNLDGYLRQRLGIHVAIVDPLGGFPGSGGHGGKCIQALTTTPAMAIAAGLALRGTRQHG
jgi:type IV pilus assembly protein PilM